MNKKSWRTNQRATQHNTNRTNTNATKELSFHAMKCLNRNNENTVEAEKERVARAFQHHKQDMQVLERNRKEREGVEWRELPAIIATHPHPKIRMYCTRIVTFKQEQQQAETEKETQMFSSIATSNNAQHKIRNVLG